MKFKSMKAVFAGMILFFSSLANAGIINSSDVAGYGTFTDDVSGYVWLDINSFFGNTAGEMKVLAEAAGFTVATRDEVITLFTSITLTGNWASNKAIIGDSNTRELIWGWHIADNDVSLFDWSWVFDYDSVLQNTERNSDGTEVGFTDIGIWAYTTTEVPEPSTVILLFLGLAGLSFARYRRQS